MLPKLLYELLPYLYLSVGFGSGVVVNSTIIIVSSVLLMMTGVLLIVMRVNYRRNIRRMYHDS